MVKSFTLQALLTAAILLGVPSWGAAQDVSSEGRTAKVIKQFDEICLRKPPNFAKITAFAEASHMNLSSDRSSTTDDGVSVQSRSWMLASESGIIEIGTSLRIDGKEKTESCGVGAPDIDGDKMRDALVHGLKLGEPEKQSASADGMRWLIFWQSNADGVPVTVMLTHDKEEDKKGVFLNAYLKSGE